MGKKITLKLELNQMNLKKVKNFFSKFEIISVFGDSNKKNILGEKLNRVCRFCLKNSNETSFKKDAHVIPEFMGNHNLLSFYECDNCNSIFSKYEDSLANFFGVSRTISQIKGKKNKVPKFKDPRTGLEIKLDDNSLNIKALENTDVYDIDKENKLLTIKTKRPGYIPLYIPKMLLKIAFSILTPDETKNYDYLRKFLLDQKNQKAFENSDQLRIIGYWIPGPPKFSKPYVLLCKKIIKKDTELCPEMIVIIQYANYQLQMILPFGENDKELVGEEVDIPFAPLFVDNSYLQMYGQEQFLNLNLTSAEKKSSEDHTISFQFEEFKEEDLRNK